MNKILDLFSGAGGFSLGFKLAGMSVDTHIEIDKYASETLKKNFPNAQIITEDIKFINPSSLNNINVIIGGPPCQGFSVAGSTQFGMNDKRNELVFWYLQFIQELSPKIAIIENVPNVLTKKSKEGDTFLDLITKIGSEMGYKVKYKILNSVNYGVPQSRRRAFIVLYSPNATFHFPEITHGFRENNKSLFQLEKVVTVGEALDDLPDVLAGQIGSGLPYKQKPNNPYQEYCRSQSNVVINHDPMKHTERVLERFRIIKQGQSLKDVPISHGQIAYGTGEKVKNPFKYNNYRLDSTKPSLTIPASYQSLFVHPQLDRNLTAREGARLMSFPDWYEFTGPKTMMSWETGLSQYNQIGNAVCPLVGRAIAYQVKDYLDKTKNLSFSTSPSNTLKNIHKNLVKHRFTLDDAFKNKLQFKIIKKLAINKCKESKYFDTNKSVFHVNNLEISLEAVTYAYNLLITKKCPICNDQIEPFGNHNGSINLLISKSNIDSLIAKEKDNGLDFHLRILTGEDKRIANEVAMILQDLEIATITTAQNPRTGKNVKSLTLLDK
ncbi:DNA cytosine methyltransferase [Aliarcobacter butzleri]|uniref:DNA cytosine methyltransferase n=1 Tax=Aliarcobacter butzleri TaxID=28197 RepID=UPI00263E7436|nr:DNA cytosine methyltransferase [Aliarcobacter butzleri]MDN5095384.1 DNA cytosine methyltransferase [Aliarcobacter butzleri]